MQSTPTNTPKPDAATSIMMFQSGKDVAQQPDEAKQEEAGFLRLGTNHLLAGYTDEEIQKGYDIATRTLKGMREAGF